MGLGRRIAVLQFLVASAACGADWPGWRGPTGMGQTEEANLPLTWGGKDDANVLWKVPLPGVESKAGQDRNQSSPVVAGGRVFVTASYWPGGRPDPKAFGVAKTHPFVIGMFDRSDQWDRWSKSFTADGFKLIKTMVISKEQIHYPNYTTDWLPDVLKYLDDGTSKLKLPTTKPAAATKPATRLVR